MEACLACQGTEERLRGCRGMRQTELRTGKSGFGGSHAYNMPIRFAGTLQRNLIENFKKWSHTT